MISNSQDSQSTAGACFCTGACMRGGYCAASPRYVPGPSTTAPNVTISMTKFETLAEHKLRRLQELFAELKELLG